MGKPNSKLDPAWRNPSETPKQGRPKKSFREGLKNGLHKFDLCGKYSEQNTF